jgi:hypothetical protein
VAAGLAEMNALRRLNRPRLRLAALLLGIPERRVLEAASNDELRLLIIYRWCEA